MGGCGINEEELSNMFVNCLLADVFLKISKYNLCFLFEDVSFVGTVSYTKGQGILAEQGASVWLVGLANMFLKWDLTVCTVCTVF